MTKKLFEIVVSNSNSSYPVQYNQTQYLNHNFKMLLQIYTHVKPGAHSRINANAHASLPCFIEVKMADVGENLDSSSSEDEEVLLSLLMLRRRRRRLRAANRKTWVKSWVSRRNIRQYHRLDRFHLKKF